MGLVGAEAEAGDFSLARGQVAGGLGGVWDDVPGGDGDEDGGEALDEEEDAPGGDGAGLAELDDEPGEGGCKRAGERCG